MSLTEMELKILVNSFMSFEYVSRDNDILMSAMAKVSKKLEQYGWLTDLEDSFL